jgi:hypothetical protein
MNLAIIKRYWLAALLFAAAAQGAEPAPIPVGAQAKASPWGFNLSSYLWLPGINGSVSAGQHSGSVDVSFIDIFNKSSRVPLGFMGRFEAHYDRFAFFVDGDYMNIQLKPVADRISDGIHSEMGIMDYGLMYRVFGATASEMKGYVGKKRPNVLDVYAGARTLWLGNSIDISGPFGFIGRSPSSSKSFTSPIIGGRVVVDFTPSWFMLADANIGGFGAQSVDFTGGILGMVGYRTTFFDYPAAVEIGYKAIRYKVDRDGPTATSATLNGPFVGLTGQW